MVDQGKLRQQIIELKNPSKARMILFGLVELSFEHEVIGKALEYYFEVLNDEPNNKD